MQFEIIITNATDLLRISALDIMCARADGNYSAIMLTDGEERIVLLQLGQLEQTLDTQLGADAAMFIRIGRGIIINREYLHAISLSRQQLTMRSPVGKKAVLSASKESLRQLKMLIDSTIKKGSDNG